MARRASWSKGTTAFYKSAGIVMVQRGIAEELHCPQPQPTTILLDNQSLIARLKHLSPAKAALKPESRMLNWLSSQVRNKIITPSFVKTTEQISDPLTKPLGPLATLRSLSILQGHQPAIQQLMDEYSRQPRTRKPTLSTHAFALATITDGFLRLNFDEQIDYNLQEAYITSLKQSSHYLRDHSRRERSYFANKFTKQIRYYKPQYNHKTYTKHLTITLLLYSRM